MIVEAVLFEDINDAGGQRGAFDLVENRESGEAGMTFICPCGCGREGYLPFTADQEPRWNWDGNRDQPTVTPSVKQVGGCEWHGWLTNGEWRSC